jgi:molecular chaperone HscB
VENPFDVLGLPARFALDPAELERRFRDVQRAVHPDRHAGAAPAVRRAALSGAVSASQAYRTLRDELARAEALLAVLGAPAAAPQADPALLMEMMTLRESLEEARGDSRRVASLRAEVEGARAAALASLGAAFDAHELPRAAALLARLRYHRRFLDEVAALEDEGAPPPAR